MTSFVLRKQTERCQSSMPRVPKNQQSGSSTRKIQKPKWEA